MKIKDGELLLNNFKFACEESGDPYLLVHFSREEDKYIGDHSGLEMMDAAIIVRQLVKEFGITGVFLKTLMKNKTS